MREHANPGRRPQDEVTVHLSDGFRPPAVPEGVTVALPGAMLAPAPTPDTAAMAEAPVFVDDSGGRKRLLRIVGVLVALLSLSFLAVVGVALAVPSVATSVGLGNLVPFMVPGAAAPPVAKPSPTPAPVVAPKPVVVATTNPTTTKAKAKPVVTATIEATETVPATMTASATVAPPTVDDSVAPTTAAAPPPSADPPVEPAQAPAAEPAAVDADPADPAVPN